MAAPIAPDAPVTTTTFPARSVFMYEESFSRRLRELRGWASSVVMALQRLQRLFFCWPHSKTFRESRLRIFQIGDHSVEFVLCHDRRQIVLTADGVPPTDSYLFPICSGFFCRHGANHLSYYFTATDLSARVDGIRGRCIRGFWGIRKEARLINSRERSSEVPRRA